MNCVIVRRVVRAVLLCLTLPPAGALAQTAPAAALNSSVTAKQTIFGSQLMPPNFPDSTLEEWYGALASIAQIGGHVSFIWNWNNPDSFDGWPELAAKGRSFGLKVVNQIAATSVKGPAAPSGFANSFGDPATRARFLEDVQRVALMHPEYLVLTTEVNFLYRFDRPEFENFRTLYAEAYALVKATSPNTKVGVSHHYTQWFAQRYLEGVDVPAMISPSDFVAFTTYPEDLIQAGIYTSLSSIPADWYGRARASYPGTPIIFSEVGWSSKPPYSSPEMQAEFMRELPRMMSVAKPELVTWSLLTDVAFFDRTTLTPEMIAFLETLGVNIDQLLSRFNGLGLLGSTGTQKPAYGAAAGMVFP